jgi:hypothetical protein
MSREIHTFVRPDVPDDSRRIGDAFSPGHNRYDEGVRYLYHN